MIKLVFPLVGLRDLFADILNFTGTRDPWLTVDNCFQQFLFCLQFVCYELVSPRTVVYQGNK